MIKQECFTKQWCETVALQLNYNDTQLIEKVIRALSALEMLVNAGCPFIFKGGTAAMMLLGGHSNRLSIDIDILCPPGTQIPHFLSSFKDYGFTDIVPVERNNSSKSVPKQHYKLFYHISYTHKDAESYILLDVLFEHSPYINTLHIPIDSPFLCLEGEPLTVSVPSVEDILGDKLTAFAPNTTGIPYFKGKKVCSVEIIKQLYDIARLFERVHNLTVTAEAFHRIVEVEMAYRCIDNVEAVYDDIIQTALLIATRGKEGVGNFQLLLDGIKKFRNFIHTTTYHLDHAIIDSAKAAYLAACLKSKTTIPEKYPGNPLIVKELEMSENLPSKLLKLRKIYPEAFFYWAKTGELLS